MGPRCFWGIGGLLATVVVAVAGCDVVTVSPSPSESTPSAPFIRFRTDSTAQFDGERWTFLATLGPNGSPTDLVLEVGSSTLEAPAFDRTIPVEAVVIAPRSMDFRVVLPEGSFCVRFTATNAVGTSSTALHCPLAGRISFPPDPSASGG